MTTKPRPQNVQMKFDQSHWKRGGSFLAVTRVWKGSGS